MRSINLREKKRKDVIHVSQGRKTWSSVCWDGLLGPWQHSLLLWVWKVVCCQYKTLGQKDLNVYSMGGPQGSLQMNGVLMERVEIKLQFSKWPTMRRAAHRNRYVGVEGRNNPEIKRGETSFLISCFLMVAAAKTDLGPLKNQMWSSTTAPGGAEFRGSWAQNAAGK